MKRNGLLLAMLLLLVSAPAFAQGWEISPFLGWKTGGNLELTPDGAFTGQVHAKDGFIAGLNLGVDPRPDFAFEAHYHYMNSGIFFRPASGGGGDVDVADMVIHQVMGDFLFSKPGRTENTFPFFLIGLGANIFDPGSSKLTGAGTTQLNSHTKFTWSLGVGVKKYTHSGSGARLDIRYNPTYINSTSTGYWCDPFYGCYTTADAHYFDQWEFSLGFVKKLGYNR